LRGGSPPRSGLTAAARRAGCGRGSLAAAGPPAAPGDGGPAHPAGGRRSRRPGPSQIRCYCLTQVQSLRPQQRRPPPRPGAPLAAGGPLSLPGTAARALGRWADAAGAEASLKQSLSAGMVRPVAAGCPAGSSTAVRAGRAAGPQPGLCFKVCDKNRIESESFIPNLNRMAGLLQYKL